MTTYAPHFLTLCTFSLCTLTPTTKNRHWFNFKTSWLTWIFLTKYLNLRFNHNGGKRFSFSISLCIRWMFAYSEYKNISYIFCNKILVRQHYLMYDIFKSWNSNRPLQSRRSMEDECIYLNKTLPNLPSAGNYWCHRLLLYCNLCIPVPKLKTPWFLHPPDKHRNTTWYISGL